MPPGASQGDGTQSALPSPLAPQSLPPPSLLSPLCPLQRQVRPGAEQAEVQQAARRLPHAPHPLPSPPTLPRSAKYAPELNEAEVKQGMALLDTNADGSIQLGACRTCGCGGAV